MYVYTYKGHMYAFFWIPDLGVSFVCLLVLQAAGEEPEIRSAHLLFN